VSSNKSRELLWQVARDGPIGPMHFEKVPPSSDDMKKAALLSLGDIAEPTKADRDVIFEVLSKETDDSEVFRAGADALSVIGESSDMARILSGLT